LRSIEENPDKPDSPVSDYLEQENINISSVINSENVKKLTALYTEFTGNLVILKRIGDDDAQRKWISTDCIRLLLSTLYLDLGIELLKQLYELNNYLRTLQIGMTPPRSIDFIIEQTESIAGAIVAVRNQLTQGEFKEPEHLSSMVWSPVESSHGRNVVALVCRSPEASLALESIANKYIVLAVALEPVQRAVI
jgi:hypothetical protein